MPFHVSALIAAGAVAIICYLLYLIRAKMRLRYWIYVAVGAVATAALLFASYDIISRHKEQWQITIFLGSVLVTVGWIVTNEISLRNSRKQHTINLITDYMINPQRITDKQTIRKYLPKYTTRLYAGAFDYNDENHELAQAIDREFNFYEFIGVGIKTGDLDERIARDCLEAVFTKFVEQVRDYIGHWRGIDARIWQALWDMNTSWSKPR